MSIFISSSCYSFPKQAKNKTIKQDNHPGPGRYIINSSSNKRLGKFDKSHKQNYSLNQNPGVGAYNTTIKSTSPMFSIGKQKKTDDFLMKTVTSPGPGRYNYSIKNLKASSPSYSITAKPKDLLYNQTPGPGSYSDAYFKAHSKGKSFAKSIRSIEIVSNESNPGPGKYSINENDCGVSRSIGKKGYSFGNQSKDIRIKLETPGPGAYTYSKGFPINTSSTFGNTKKNDPFKSLSNENVGPGRYTNTDKISLNKGFKIPLSPRKLHSDNQNPGPGAYESNDQAIKSNSVKFSLPKSSKIDEKAFSTCSTSPGPGRYFQKEENKSKGFTFSKDILEKRSQITPGPGEYQSRIDYIKPSSVSCIVSKSVRDGIYKGNDNPGPGQYLPIGNESKGVVFSKDLRMKDEGNVNPGPGQYNLPNSIRDFMNVLYK